MNVNGGVPLMANPSVIAIVWMVYSLPLTYLERMADARQLIQTEVDGISEPELITFLTRFVGYVNSTWIDRYMPGIIQEVYQQCSRYLLLLGVSWE